MTTFSYTTGNPANLTGGGAASMNDIAGPFTDVQTFVNGANIDTSNLATSAKPATLLGAYRTIHDIPGAYWDNNDTVLSQFIYGTSGLGMFPNTSASQFGRPVIPFDPADYAVSGLTTRLRIRAAVVVDDTAPAITFTVGLYPITSVGAANSIRTTLGVVVTGSQAAVVSPPANQTTQAVSSDFTPPAAGIYSVGVLPSGSPAGSSGGLLYAALQVHHV